MKYKEFLAWCNQRACDGCWGLETAKVCIEVITNVRRLPFWKRERVWQKINAVCAIEENWVEPTNRKIAELRGADRE